VDLRQIISNDRGVGCDDLGCPLNMALRGNLPSKSEVTDFGQIISNEEGVDNIYINNI
jgi:hypothetical protein